MDDQVADALLSTVQNGDEPEQVRARAAISLGPALELADTEGFDDDLSEPPVTRMMFQRIRATLRRIHSDERAPKEVRRRVLEASVRSPQDWHEHAIRAAYSSGDKDWTLTAVFCMRWIRGFDVQIIEMLESPNSDIHYEAVQAAGMQRVHAAWAHVAALMVSATTAKRLRLAAIEAAAGIRPGEARQILAELADSEDEEIAEAASEALLETDYAEEAGEDDEDLPKDFRH
jgi:HEAT repeat protein